MENYRRLAFFHANLKPIGLKKCIYLMPDLFSQYDSEPRVSTDGIVPLEGDITAIVFTGI